MEQTGLSALSDKQNTLFLVRSNLTSPLTPVHPPRPTPPTTVPRTTLSCEVLFADRTQRTGVVPFFLFLCKSTKLKLGRFIFRRLFPELTGLGEVRDEE